MLPSKSNVHKNNPAGYPALCAKCTPSCTLETRLSDPLGPLMPFLKFNPLTHLKKSRKEEKFKCVKTSKLQMKSLGFWPSTVRVIKLNCGLCRPQSADYIINNVKPENWFSFRFRTATFRRRTRVASKYLMSFAVNVFSIWQNLLRRLTPEFALVHM